MRLLDVHQLELKEFPNEKTRPSYAILSHTWDDGEVSLHDLQTPTAASMAGYSKIKKCCDVAIKDGFQYVWIDTCCIDKTSSAELSEAINSMYTWYESATVCYAYLSDMKGGDDPNDPESSFSKSRWFTRGWTLQELIAPEIVIFHDQDWADIGTKATLQEEISRITGIPREALLNIPQDAPLSIAHRMSWAAMRETTRVEDIAYCLMGIFKVNMPTLYGEGKKAFVRLQLEIMKISNDQSLFAWAFDVSTTREPHQFPSPSGFIEDCESESARLLVPDNLCRMESSLLSDSPRHFRHSRGVWSVGGQKSKHSFSMTNNGIHIWLPMFRVPANGYEVYKAILDCVVVDGKHTRPLAVYMKGSQRSGQYGRVLPSVVCIVAEELGNHTTPIEIYAKDILLEYYNRDNYKKFEYQLSLVENASPDKGYTIKDALYPKVLEHGMIHLLVNPIHSLVDVSYVIVGTNRDPSTRYLIALGLTLTIEKSAIYCNIRSGKLEIEEAIAATRRLKRGDLTQLYALFHDVDPINLGARIIKRLSSGQSISINFRKGPESSDRVQICHVVIEFITLPTRTS